MPIAASGRFVQGVACVIAGAILWGFSGGCVQYLQLHYAIDSMFLAMCRMLGAGVLFLVLLLVTHRNELRQLLHEPRQLGSLAIFGTLGLFMCQITYIITIGYTNAGTATVMQSLNVVMVLAVTCIAVRRLPRAMEVTALVLALTAVVLIATKGDLGTLNMPLAGLLWGLLSACAVTLYTVYPHKLFARWGSLVTTGMGMFIGGLVSLVLWAAMGVADGATGGAVGTPLAIPALGLDGVLAALGVVVLGTFGAFGLFLHGVSVVGGVRGSLLGCIEPVSATCFSAFWLGTLFSWADWVGLVLMITTTVLVTLAGARGAKREQADQAAQPLQEQQAQPKVQAQQEQPALHDDAG